MDQSLQELLFQEEERMVWYEDVRAPTGSAFVPYINRQEIELGFLSEETRDGFSNRSRNMNKRMIEILKRDYDQKMKGREPEKERCNRHMMNERIRRERQKQNYVALHSVLPFGAKKDKNSIIQNAAERIQDLQRRKKELEKRIWAIEKNLMAEKMEESEDAGTKIRLRVPNPTSGCDSMIEVLKCLKDLGTRTRFIQAKFSSDEFSAVMNIETEIVAGEVEKAVERTLNEVEWKLLFHVPEAQSN